MTLHKILLFIVALETDTLMIYVHGIVTAIEFNAKNLDGATSVP